MIPLPLANILHHKLRSALSALGVGVGVCMLITLAGLSRGSLGEIAGRWSAVQADLIVYPSHWGDNISTISGAGLGQADAEAVAGLTVGEKPLAEYIVPVYLYSVRVRKNNQNLVGVDSKDLRYLTGGKPLVAGRSFDPDGAFSRWLSARMDQPGSGVIDIGEEELAKHGGLEMVIDARLARTEKLSVGDTVYTVGHHFKIVGIAPEGSLTRAMVPRATAEYLFNGRLGRYTLLFVKLREGVNVGAAVQAVGQTRRLKAVPPNGYLGMLESQFGAIYFYLDTVNAVTMGVAFLFILITLYTMVIQHLREIAILKSMGASKWFVMRQVVGESLLLTCAGALLGVLASWPLGWLIMHIRPLLTVTISWHWILIGAGGALLGGLLASIYPAFCAMRTDVVEALSLE